VDGQQSVEWPVDVVPEAFGKPSPTYNVVCILWSFVANFTGRRINNVCGEEVAFALDLILQE
jgi:hypothetical protein